MFQVIEIVEGDAAVLIGGEGAAGGMDHEGVKGWVVGFEPVEEVDEFGFHGGEFGGSYAEARRGFAEGAETGAARTCLVSGVSRLGST